MGLDDREILPPFFPFQRNEDGLFGTVLSGTSSQHCAAFIPGTIRHSPSENSSAPIEGLWRDLTRWRVPEYLLALISHVMTTAQPPLFSRAVSGVAEDLITIGRLPHDSFRALVVNLRHITLASQLHGVDSSLSTVAENELLRSEVMLIQEFILSYGILLRNWPAIHGGAQVLNQQSAGFCVGV